jgi:hypothetical protein
MTFNLHSWISLAAHHWDHEIESRSVRAEDRSPANETEKLTFSESILSLNRFDCWYVKAEEGTALLSVTDICDRIVTVLQLNWRVIPYNISRHHQFKPPPIHDLHVNVLKHLRSKAQRYGISSSRLNADTYRIARIEARSKTGRRFEHVLRRTLGWKWRRSTGGCRQPAKQAVTMSGAGFFLRGWLSLS